MEWEDRARLAVFDRLAALAERHDEVLPRAALEAGVTFGGELIRLIGPQGIFKPRRFQLPLSITTAPPVPGREPPYPDRAEGDRLRYAYRGTDPQHRDNVGLRWAMQKGTPLVYFLGVVPGQYLATWPVHIVADDPATLTFTVALDAAIAGGEAVVAAEAPVRGYAVRSVRHRLHQRVFRERVLAAYRKACAMCRLRHAELLDAAHILEDSDERSTTAVSNGIALCKLHHAAFDHHIVGVHPDRLVVEVRSDILAEVDGPMLRHGLQGLAGRRMDVPRAAALQPDPIFLAERYHRFRAAG
jgi:putative restriction endonuclease